jgi:predicted Zn-dependent protease
MVAALAVATMAPAVPARAQLGGIMRRAQQAQDAKNKFDDLNVTDAEERQIGEDVSAKIRARFGVVQDKAIHEYVTKIGLLLAQQSERPTLDWTFVVLDTDGVNAFASPGGIVHITRGALALAQNEAEVAGVLAHEIGHVAHKHTVNAIRKNKAVQLGTQETVGNRGLFLDQLANKAYEIILENSFDRGDELDADKVSVQLTAKVGYAPDSLAGFLQRLDDRNKDMPQRNGLFASHPETKERIEKIRQAAAKATGATVQPRFAANVHYELAPLASIAAVEDGSAGLTSGGSSSGTAAGSSGKDAKDGKDAKAGSQRPGLGLTNLSQSAQPEKQSGQVSASGGARGVGPDRAAKGGDNPNLVKTTVSAAQLAEFKKGIV